MREEIEDGSTDPEQETCRNDVGTTSMKPNVYQFVPHCSPGGMQQVARLLDHYLPETGVSSSLVALDDWLGSGPALVSVPRGWWRLVRFLQKNRPTAVFAHAANTAAFVLTAAWVAGVGRRVAIVHGSLQLVGARRAKVVQVLSRLGAASDVVFVGQASAKSFGSRIPITRSRVIANGLPLRGAPPAVDSTRKAGTDQVLRLVCAARMVPEKNHQVLLRAVQPLSDVKLVLCGDGPERSALERYARQHRLDVEFTGHLDSDRLWSVYAESDAFVFPSLLEGLPLVLIEAAAAGLPVIASDTGQNRDVMGDAAIYCPADEPTAWTTAIGRLRDRATRRTLAELGHARSPLFEVSRMAADYARLVREPPG